MEINVLQTPNKLNLFFLGVKIMDFFLNITILGGGQGQDEAVGYYLFSN